ncbi:SDR family NAD(P)-dependent oxidoreductase [Actinopolyspora sp. H202]|uniref:SDR family NAD(P)-dependent oxidoreductase n=1 Tax=Actinopolyspora sp. H202 TaxID=1500456 RepID=UPI003EE6991C
MDIQLEQLLRDLEDERVTKEHVKRILNEQRDRRLPAETSRAGEQPEIAASPEPDLVRCLPVWEEVGSASNGGETGHLVLLVGPAEVERALRERAPGIDIRLLHSEASGIADRYADLATETLDTLRVLLNEQPPRTLVQLVCPQQGENSLLSGLFALVESAGLENPKIVPQLVSVDTSESADSAAAHVLECRNRSSDRTVRVRDGRREVQTWREMAGAGHAPLPWREGGTYVVTGGLGGVGLIFARDLLRSVQSATVVLAGRSPLDDDRRRLLNELRGPHARVEYVRVDVADAAGVERFLAQVRREYGAIHGIIHGAGVLRDGFVLHKDAAQLREVLAPKVAGTVNLDVASEDEPLDFFAVFSSTAAVTGNAGQSDYAAANAFMDRFAHHRDRLVAAGQRSGRSLSLNWPLWAEGGMPVGAETERALWEHVGMRALRTGSGLQVFYESLDSGYSQVMAIEGDGQRIRRALLGQPTEASVGASSVAPAAAVVVDGDALYDKVVLKLRQEFGAVIGLASARIDAQTPLQSYGIDSLVVTRLNRKLAGIFADLPKSLLYEFDSLAALAEYFVREHRQRCLQWTGLAAARQSAPASQPVADSSAGGPSVAVTEPAPALSSTAEPTEFPDSVAVIGMSGRFPMARNLGEFWENLDAGRDCITEIPEGRWSLDGFYHPDRDEAVAAGLSYSKWGGFLEGFAEFDPLFFNISPHEAMSMDPQERLFLQESWNALEDAGYTRQRLAEEHRRRVGVFAGVSKTGFDLYGPDLWRRNEKLHPLTSFASVANRVSYLLDLKGPSVPVDTLCSSSLSAVHEAVQHLLRGECDLAIAGGVNLYLHPSNYTLMSGKRMLSDDGRCRSFGAGGSGFVPGEGVAAVLLKRLSDAERDNDVIRAVIRGSRINHGGRSNGYTVPNPVAQAEVVREALDHAGVSAADVGFVETHGTGTELGDPIEVDGLAQAFAPDTDSRQYCAIGSVKSNIGHLEAAAGIAGLLKVILQMQHGHLAASLHAQEPNPNIDFTRTPFRLQRQTTEWTRPTTIDDAGETLVGDRIAGVSSFGAGGANAHVVVSEYRPSGSAPLTAEGNAPYLIVLSAKDTERLRERARDLLGWLRLQDSVEVDLGAVACTLQLGREPMEARLALTVGTPDELISKLAEFVAGEQDIEDLHFGLVTDHRETLAALGTDSDMAAAVEMWIAKGKYDRLLGMWVKGLAVDWGKLYGQRRPRMVPLPGYPFARESYWVGDLAAESGAGPISADRLHPLVHTNTSTLDAQQFGSVLSGEEFFLADHVVDGRKVLPGAAYLEMARAALEASLAERPQRMLLRNVVWAQPLTVAEEAAYVRTMLHAAQVDGAGEPGESAGEVAFEISSVAGGTPDSEAVVHSKGVIRGLKDGDAPAAVDVTALREVCGATRIDADQCYRTYQAMGLDYGPAHRGIDSVEVGDEQALARLRLPAAASADVDDYVLHPSLLDAALQAAVGLFGGETANRADTVLHLPYAVDEVEILGPCAPRMWSWVRYSDDDRPDSDLRKLDIDILDDTGTPRCRLRGLTSRVYDAEASTERIGGDLPHARSPAAAEDGAQPGDTPEEQVRRYLAGVLSSELGMSVERIDADGAFENYGIDSIMALNLTNLLERVFGSLPKTLFYEYPSISALAGYFLEGHRDRLTELLAVRTPELSSTPPNGSAAGGSAAARGGAPAVRPHPAGAREKRREPEDSGTEIAIVGLAGRYPQARDIREFWGNLAEGRDCITEVPADRWDHGRYFDPDRNAPGKTYTKWGGFLDDVDHFDALFFSIAPREAAFMDPQERLFLECVYETLEDAGYTRETLSHYSDRGLPGNVGVFAGVMYGEYQLYGAQEQAFGHNITLSSSASTIANRVSYVFDLHGPSLAVDTMCSSSLTALHLACQSLRTGSCELAIAGGVNLSLHPNKYLMLGSGQYASSTGRCVSFGAGGDGYVPGEGVGAVLLKPLARAREDNDIIYGVIRGTSVNHGGRTNGYSVPNPGAQHNVIGHALRSAGVDAGSVSYVEAHGTGTALGDPIEIAGLTRAFREQTDRDQFCAIGSVKSNIGHAESAAGIAALTKVLLQMKHGEIVPSLHSEVINPNIEFEGSPFHVARQSATWSRPTGADGTEMPRIAGISSFGAGGSNAHVIVEEHISARRAADSRPAEGGPAVIVLSARTADGLRSQADQLLRWTSGGEGAETEPADIAYTLQMGREAHEERLGFIAATIGELTVKLRAFLDGEAEGAGLYRGRVERQQGSLAVFTADVDQTRVLEAAIAQRSYGELLRLWTTGLVVDWTKLHTDAAPRRVSMPTYPFQGESYWFGSGAATGQGLSTGPAQLHPLLHVNTSTLAVQRFTSVYTGEEFFLRDHRVRGQRVLSGAACLELARAAVAASLDEPRNVSSIRHVVWTRPVTVQEQGLTVQVRLWAAADDEVGFAILSPGDSSEGTAEVVHSEGLVRVTPPSNAETRLDLSRLRDECREAGPEADEFYAACEARGIVYGPAHRGVQRLWTGTGQVLARIALPTDVRDTLDDYGLHPSLVDSALQVCAGLPSAADGEESLLLPFAVDEVEIFGHCSPVGWVWVRESDGRVDEALRRVDIDLCDDDGRVFLRLTGVALRAHTDPATTPALFATPCWVTEEQESVTDPTSEGLVLVAELPEVATALETRDDARVVRLESSATDPGDRYTGYALRVLAEVKSLLGEAAQHPVRVQLIASAVEPSLPTGLAAVLKSAGLENPRLLGQTVLVDSGDDPERAASQVTAERAALADACVRYRRGSREVLKWRAEDGHRTPGSTPWKDGGVYLITGGAGGLGTVFAQDIARRARTSRIVIAGRSPHDAHKEALLEQLRRHGAETVYVQADVAVRDEAVALVGEAVQRYGRIDGILHAAGFVADAFVVRKDADEFSRVLAPKVAGLVHLDEATHDADLDFLVAFSSVAGALGNVGQADYAAANAFMDAFAAHRNALVARGERQGRTVSVGWPLWADGGMHVDASTERSLHERFGLVSMSGEAGVDAFTRALAGQADQVMVLAGDRVKISQTLLSGLLVDGPAPRSAPARQVVDGSLSEAKVAEPLGGPDEIAAQQAEAYFKRLLASAIDLPAARIDPEVSLEDYGVDSVMTMEMTRTLEEVFGSLPKTLFFEHRTITDLTRHFLDSYPDQLRELLPAAGVDRQTSAAPQDGHEQTAPEAGRSWPVASAAPAESTADSPSGTENGDIAIIGLAGRYPQARDVREFWQNLAAGKDCVTEIPHDRWDGERFFDPDKEAAGKSYTKWGGFLDGAYEFDPQFFNISPREAEIMDPQERLFLQCVHDTLEDAGYVRDTGKDRTGNMLDGRVGVFAGVMYQEYQLFGARTDDARATPVVPGSSASIANRVSHVFNLRGPSMSVDTMCSSSLMAVHLACRSLKWGDCDTAIAGGVNLSLHPNKYLVLSQGRLASSNGHCASFGADGDGYVPGEGVGAVLLKPLARAIADGDRIYGVVKGTAANHRGRSNGYSVPEPQGQADAIGEALRHAGVDARTVSYIEANSTGTVLGDPIEIAGLCKAFGPHTDERGFCAIGSVKSNIGHAESAAGIAGITKVLLQLQHGQLAPSLHAATSNPHIEFEQTPFVLQRELSEWPRAVPAEGAGSALPRVAGVSAFGAAGSNVHVVIGEYIPEGDAARPSTGPRAVIPLSARTSEQLRARAERLVRWLDHPENSEIALADVAYTLQVGREAREERVGVLATSVSDLIEKLRQFSAGEFDTGEIVRGSVTRDVPALTLFAPDSDLDAMIAAWAGKGKYERLLELWVNGVLVNWRLLYRTATPRRVALPTYPFAAERYFAFDDEAVAAPGPHERPTSLHPLVQVNTSDFTEQRFSSVLSGREHFLDDCAGQIVPSAAFLEMAVAASCLSCRTTIEPAEPVVLRDVVLTQPLRVADGPREVHIGLRPEDDSDIRFQISSTPPGAESDVDAAVHGGGFLYFAEGTESTEKTVLDLLALQDSCERDRGGHGPGHRTVRHIWTRPRHALLQLELPERDIEGGVVLHPNLLDAAVRACSDIVGRLNGRGSTDGGGGLVGVRAIEEVLVLDACTSSMWAWVRPSSEQADDSAFSGFDIDLADEHGRVRIRIGGLTFDRAPSERDDSESTRSDPPSDDTTSGTRPELCSERVALLHPQWHARPAPSRSSGPAAARPTVLLAGLPEVADLLRDEDSDVVVLTTEEKTPDRRYTAYGLQILQHLRSGAVDRGYVQLVLPGTSDAALLSGLAAVLMTAELENLTFTGQVVILDRTDTAERAVERIRENRRCVEDTLVRYADGRREVRAWSERDTTAATGTLPWKENGVYLVTGESGSLGSVIAQEIAVQAGNATVVLVGRASPSVEHNGVSREPSAVGAVHCEQADIASPAEVDALVARTLDRFGRIDGVVHSAGITRDAPIADKAAREFLDVLAPKVAGVVNLDTATRSLPLDFFVTFSSTSAVNDNIGRGGAAADAFLYAYAQYRQELVARGERSGHSQSVDWPPGEVGTEALYRILHSEHHQLRVWAPSRARDESDALFLTQQKFPVFSTAGTDS